MSTKKAIGISFVAIFILIIAQIIAQVIASVFVIIKIPYGICNIIAGIIYVGLTYLILKKCLLARLLSYLFRISECLNLKLK